MTYKELLRVLSYMSDSQLNSDVVIHDIVDDEYYGPDSGVVLEFSELGEGTLDEGHPVIRFQR